MRLKGNHVNVRAARLGLRRGSSLVAAMGCVFLLMMLGAGLVSVTIQAVHQAGHIQKGILAFNVAESGCERAVRWLKEQPSPPTGTAAFDPFGGDQALGDGTYSIMIEPDANNPGASLKAYKIISTGTIHGRTETIEMIMRQQSFGRYAYFTDRETSAITGGRIWFFSGDRIRGPAHSNNDNGSNFQINWGSGTGPIFEDMVTAAGPSMNYSPSEPDTEPEFLNIYKTGSRGYMLDVDDIPLPSSSNTQRDAAWGSTSGFPGTNGVYVPAAGGIYIRGDSSVTLSVNGTDQQVFRIVQGTTTTTVTIDLVNNRRIVQVGAAAPTYVAGSGTGVLYSTGHINDLGGTVADNRLSGSSPPEVLARNAYTIAADVNAGKEIRISNDIEYRSDPDPNISPADPVNLRPGTLGLIGRNVRINIGAPRNLEIDAIVLAGSEATTDGSFHVQDYNTKMPTGTLRLRGGIIQKARGAVGTLVGGSLYTGYAKDYRYDPRLADNPPPFFPTTGLYDRISWRRMIEDEEEPQQ